MFGRTRILAIAVILIIGSFSMASGSDLCHVFVRSHHDAALLTSTGADGIFKLADGYLVLVDGESAMKLRDSRLESKLIEVGVSRDEIAFDHRPDRTNVGRYPLLFEEGGIRLFKVDAKLLSAEEAADFLPVSVKGMEFTFFAPRNFDPSTLKSLSEYDSIIALVRQDSLLSYTNRLQKFFRRYAGTDSNYASAEWVKSKFQSFGYSDVSFDYFMADIDGVDKQCKNVVARKTGSVFPNQQVVIGAHRDAVEDSPGADDDGSGTAAVLEIARVLEDYPSQVTMVFITFDAEEQGLFGSNHYADAAKARGDSIIAMLNMDMIAHITNNNRAYVYHSVDSYYAQVLQDLLTQLVGITGYLAGSSSSSDHFPFQQNGYDVVFLHEYNFSSVYHTFRDSTTYMNFEYMTRMTKAMTALAVFLNSDDRDQDGIANVLDNCPDDTNPLQEDDDTDGVGNSCDNCLSVYNPDQWDEDFNGVGDRCDGKIHIVSYDPPDGYLNQPYFYQLEAIGGVEPYRWSKLLGQPPYGCVFTGGTAGTISGTALYKATYYMTIEVVDSDAPQKKDTLSVTILVTDPPEPGYICGDVDDSDEIDIDDVVYLIGYVFTAGPAPIPVESGDVNCADSIDVDDIVYLITYIFASGPPPCDC
jgi:hypothetical protein